MKSSGNGTAASQKLYVLWNFPFLHVVKIGITGNMANRRKNISETTPGFVFPIFVVKLPFAYHLEQKMHRLFKPFNMPFGKDSSGHSEWFFLGVAPFAIAIMAACQLFWIGLLTLVVLIFLWIGSGCPDEVVRALARLIN